MHDDDDNIYAAFLTDSKLEAEGVWIDYGLFRVKVARAGGANRRYIACMERLLRPFQRAVKTESLPNEMANKIVKSAFAETIISGWETQVSDDQGGTKMVPMVKIPGVKELVAPSREAYLQVFDKAPDLFADLQAEASRGNIYRTQLREANAGN